MPHNLIETKQLSLKYGSKVAFTDINLDIPEGGITAIVGPSGCGKSSFLSCLNRLTDLIPHCRVTGEIRIGDLDVLSPKTNAIALRRQVSLISQKPNPFPFSIWKNLVFPLKEHGIKDRRERDEIVEKSLQAVGLWQEVKDRLKNSALSLSGGQQQRLCIARAIALSPQIILMDEPCSALDPISSGVVEDLISSLGDKYTVVIVTHNLPQAKRIANRVACFWVNEDRGHLLEYGTTERIFTAPENPMTAAYVNGVRG